ncbi:MAG: MmcQ/YjbR family DNA-binding protein [Eubacterium sp.]|nr:MmcQ/YjbR family DNA-binding protein [Eubacterium sp.]
MTRQDVFDYVKEQYGTEPDYPWFDDNAVLRHENIIREGKADARCTGEDACESARGQTRSGKWYGVVLTVGREKLGLVGDGMVDVLNVKSDPLLIGSLRTKEGYHPAYHMNKDNWISIRLDGTAPDNEIRHLIDMSFDLTAPKKKGK